MIDNAEEYLKNLNPHSAVFEENIKYDYTEKQLILFAELYHKHKVKNNVALDIISKRFCLCKKPDKRWDSGQTCFCDKCEKLVNAC